MFGKFSNRKSQQSSRVLGFFILHRDQESSWSTREFFLFRLDLQSSRNVGKKFFREISEIFIFLTSECSLLKYKNFFKLGVIKFHFLKNKKSFQIIFFFSSLGSSLLKFFKLEIRNSCFLKYKKKFFLRKCKNFFNLGVRKFHFPKYKKNDFFEKL